MTSSALGPFAFHHAVLHQIAQAFGLPPLKHNNYEERYERIVQMTLSSSKHLARVQGILGIRKTKKSKEALCRLRALI